MLPIRRLPKHEYYKYTEHLLSLDSESKRLRFAYQIKDEAISKFADSLLDKSDKHTLFVIEDINLKIIGVGHISLEGEKMELAFSVLHEYQGHGYGSALMERCIEWCRNRNIRDGYMVCLQTNDKMKNLAKKHGLKMKSEYGETTADVELPSATAETLFHEAYASNLAAFDHFNKASIKIANTALQSLIFTY